MSKKIDLETTKSQHKGFLGLFESTMRRFTILVHLGLMIPIYLVACAVLGTALIPSVYTFKFFHNLVLNQNEFIQNATFALSLAMCYFIYGCTLVFVAPLTNFIFQAKLKEWRGPYYSVESLKWFIHNGLTYLVRFTFLEFLTPSPLGLLFYRMMGMKMGKGVVINTTWISDPSLIELGNKVTLGGSVTLVAHYGQGGLLIVAPVRIGNNCTIGLKSTVMGGVTIGDGAKLLPHSIVLPKTVIPAGETWGGVPAAKIDLYKLIKNAA
ncbi:MAG: DapH/DapD/GlmU-related protein [Pseudobdellovibrio sp.]